MPSKPGITVEASQRAEPEVRLSGRLAGMSLPRQVLWLSAWPLLEQVLAFVVGATDLFLAGRMVGEGHRTDLLDAMGLGGYVAWFFNILQAAVATGVMALVSRATGGGEHGLANRSLGQGLWLGVAAGVASMVVLLGGLNLLVSWVGLNPAAADLARQYLRVLAWSAPFSGALFAINAALRGAGDTRTPFLAMLVVNGVNIAASWALVFGPAPLGGHGVGGIALGSVFGWIAGLACSVGILMWRGLRVKRSIREAAEMSRSMVPIGVAGGEVIQDLHFSAGTLRPDGSVMRRILRIGAPQSMEIAGMWMIHAFGIRVIESIPVTGVLGAHILAIRVESLSFLPGFAIGTAAAALTGQYLGAGSRKMAVKAVRMCWLVAVVLMSGMGVVFFFFRRGLIGMLVPGSELHIDLAAPLLVVCAVTQPFFATNIIMKTSMRGAGDTRRVMVWSFGSMLIYRVGVLWWLSVAKAGEFTLTWVWVVLSLDLFTQAILFSILHFRGKWLDARV